MLMPAQVGYAADSDLPVDLRAACKTVGATGYEHTECTVSAIKPDGSSIVGSYSPQCFDGGCGRPTLSNNLQDYVTIGNGYMSTPVLAVAEQDSSSRNNDTLEIVVFSLKNKPPVNATDTIAYQAPSSGDPAASINQSLPYVVAIVLMGVSAGVLFNARRKSGVGL